MSRFTISALLVALTALPLSQTLAQAPARPGGAAAATKAVEPLALKGKIDAVTVYRGQALVTRIIDIPSPVGLTEVIITDLPDRLVPSSIFAEAADGKEAGVEVRSVRYRTRPVPQDVREEVRKLDEEIRKIQDAMNANQKHQQVLGEQRTYLEKLANFTAPTANVEITKGILNADQLKTLTQFQFTQRQDIATQELKLSNEQRDLQEAMNLKNRQRAEITSNTARSVREAVVFLNLTKAGGKLQLRYLVDQATWTPSYNIRSNEDRKLTAVEYQASIVQQSGEDWGDVAMTLSTATPSLVANAPRLDPLSISLSTVQRDQAQWNENLDYNMTKLNLSQQRISAENIRNSGKGIVSQPGGKPQDSSWVLLAEKVEILMNVL